jgi:hypothetical protein
LTVKNWALRAGGAAGLIPKLAALATGEKGMFARWICRPVVVGVSLGLTLAAAVAGCGGQPTDSGEAVVVPAPDVNVSSRAPSGGTAAPSGGAGGPAATAGPTGASPAAPTKSEGWGTLKGQIVFSGTAEAPKVLQEKGKAIKDPDVCAAEAPIMSERLVVDPATKGVKNVLVYLPRPTSVNEDARKSVVARTVEFDQKHCVFAPHVMGLMTGVKVTLKSSDPKPHNINVKLKKLSFNSTIADKAIDITPTDAERTPGAVICDIHPWMSAWWMVLDNPYFAVTDEKGNYEIKNVPAGTQKVVIWQEAVKGQGAQGFLTLPAGEDVTIKANDATVKDLTIDSSKLLPAT